MWGIAIILIGGVYWTYKFMDEKIDEEIAQKYENNANEINRKIRATQDEEQYIKNSLKSSETRWKMLDSISDDLEKIYGADWMMFFTNDSNFEGEYSMIYSSWGKAYHLLLSKIGKIPTIFSRTYQLGGVGDKRRHYIIEACRCIEKNIKIFYPDLRIMFVPGSRICGGNKQEFYDEIYLGELYWEHNIPHRNKKWNPEIRRLW